MMINSNDKILKNIRRDNMDGSITEQLISDCGEIVIEGQSYKIVPLKFENGKLVRIKDSSNERQ
jgi:hypothetical protein